MLVNQTVAAVSTPYGKGGVALIRVSGPEAIDVCARVFLPASGGSLAEADDRKAVYGTVVSEGERIDDALATVFRAPRSFTGEDTVEISCHGGLFVTERVLAAVLAAGALAAAAGEFTRRAFLNGKLSLSEAEAVADVIDAHSREQLRLAGANARGALSARMNALYEQLQTLLAACCADVDFPDENLSGQDTRSLQAGFSQIKQALEGLCATYRTGKAVREGIDTVIVGKPNTGKSSLLNLMCGSDRAIVTELAGTTRDLLEEKVIAGRVTLNLCDTAGLRPTQDRVERMGVERAYERLEHAELVLAVFDSSCPLDRFDARLIERIRSLPAAKIAVVNKTDLPQKMDPYQFDSVFDRVLSISCALGEGREQLFGAIEELYAAGAVDYDTAAVVSNARQYAALRSSADALQEAVAALSCGQSPDIAALDAERALGLLGEADGKSVSEGIVNEVFARFCVGK